MTVKLPPDSATPAEQDIEALGIATSLLPTQSDKTEHSKAAGNDVPPGLAIIEAGATELAEVTKKAAVAAGGLVVVATGVLEWFARQNAGLQIALVASAAALLAAIVLGFASVASADLRSRGLGAAAQYSARSQLVESYLRTRAKYYGVGGQAEVNASDAIKSAERELALFTHLMQAKPLCVRLEAGAEHVVEDFRVEPVTQKLQVGADGNWYNVVDVVTWWPLNSTRLHAKWVD